MKTSNQEERNKLALEYHAMGRPGKIEVIATKPCTTQWDLSLAYSPGVAQPCLEIARDPELAYKYTAKGNLVAVISNGTAVLGLGDIGAQAGKPVMEGKGVLFKRFADIDVFDIEVNETDVDKFCQIVKALEPTFGGVNLEDIKAPECFEIETRLKEEMSIPVFHDDQHGTAIIATAAFINALEVTNRDIKTVKVVFSGAGAAAIACANMFIKLGVKKENLTLCDSKGAVFKGRKDGMNKYKEAFAIDTKSRTLADAMVNADAFIGCSAKGVVSKDMVKSMAKNPIIFAMANPDPEITPEEVKSVRDDAIMATGRSDYPNQVNNVLGFPFLFRGALDVRATKINEEMKLAAAYALSNLAKEDVPESVKEAYGNANFTFGREYLIPKPFDKRVLTRVSPAVAKAAMDSGVAKVIIEDLNAYAQSLEARLGPAASFMRSIRDRINNKTKPKIIFVEGLHSRVLKAVAILADEGKIEPIILGNVKEVKEKMEELHLSSVLKDIEIITPSEHPQFKNFFEDYFTVRQRKGVSYQYARDIMARENYFGAMMVKKGYADGMITGAAHTYPECIKPVMRVVGTANHAKAAGVIILIFKNRVLFLADCTVQIEPTAEDLSDIALATADLYREMMNKEPRVGFLSYSNFGSNDAMSANKVRKAVALTKKADPKLICDGELQADVAVNDELLKKLFGFSSLDQAADILVFPGLNSANISYKLLTQLAQATAVGPILVPMEHSINIAQRTSNVDELVNMAYVTALQAQHRQIKKKGKK
ncbi:MAG: NADP-dependent malic enzyme [Bacteriovoracaceae bacterium]